MADEGQARQSYYRSISIRYEDGYTVNTVISQPIATMLEKPGPEREALLKTIRQNYDNARMSQVEGDPQCPSEQTASATPTMIVECSEPVEEEPVPATMKVNECFTHEQTLFFIEIMRQQLLIDDNLPSSISELEKRMKLNRGSKRAMWTDKANHLTDKFKEVFAWEKVARKWQTLIDGYKNAKDNAKKTGRGVTNFQYFDIMDSLLGDRHDVEPPVTGSAQGITVHKPEQLFEPMEETEDDQTEGGSSTSGSRAPSPSSSIQKGRRKRKSNTDSILDYMKEADEEARRDKRAILNQLEAATITFEKMATMFAQHSPSASNSSSASEPKQ